MDRPSPALTLPDAVAPGLRWLAAQWRAHRTHFACQVSDDRAFTGARPVAPERFTALVIGQLLDAAAPSPAGELARAVAVACGPVPPGAPGVHFFLDPELLPADADCTAVACLLRLAAGHPALDEAHRAFDRIAANTAAGGVVATYFDPTGERDGIVDAVVAANVMRLAWRLGRAAEVGPTWRHLRALVEDGRFLAGTRYYPSPDCLLYALSLGEPFPALVRALERRLGATDDTLDLAQRALAARRLGLRAGADRARLAARAPADGVWPAEGWFCYGRSRRWFGSAALTTAFATAALAGR